MNRSSDRHRVVISGPARRRLPAQVGVATVEFVAVGLPDHPAQRSKPLFGELEGLWSARPGDGRVLLWIDEGVPTVVVMRVAYRADAYRTPPA